MRHTPVFLAVALVGCMATNPPETQREKEERFIAEGMARLKVIEDLANYRRYKIGNERRRAFTEVILAAWDDYERELKHSLNLSKQLQSRLHENAPENLTSQEKRSRQGKLEELVDERMVSYRMWVEKKAVVARLRSHRTKHLPVVSINRISDEARRTDERFEIDAHAKQEYEKALIEARAIWKKGHD